MRFSSKPVHQCYTCLLNLSGQCWEFDCPRRQWSGKRCEGFENETLYAEYRAWLEAPNVKTRKQLRQEAFRNRTIMVRRKARTARGKKK